MTQSDRNTVPDFRPIHPFPARMAASLVAAICAKQDKKLRILDPMCGSGTTVVTGRYFGHKVFGIDSDPLAVLISRVWSSDIDRVEIANKAGEVLQRARDRYKSIRQGAAYPFGACQSHKSFVRFWFDPTNRRQLLALAESISRVRGGMVRDVLWCAFSRLIITKSQGASLGIDISHSRPHRVYEVAPVSPLAHFLRQINFILRRSPFSSTNGFPAANVLKADARQLPMEDESFDLIITSPPYLNAIDYMRGHKLSLIWMGHAPEALTEIRARNIGTERTLASSEQPEWFGRLLEAMGLGKSTAERTRGMLARYAADMDRVLAEMRRLLAPDGQVILVIGDSYLRGEYIRNSVLLTTLAQNHGFRLISKKRRRIQAGSRYLPPPRSSKAGSELQKRMRSEVILTLVKD